MCDDYRLLIKVYPFFALISIRDNKMEYMD